ncbi:MAG: 1-deoxy-D-xylulose-5-phosphate reductoisomerase, partial [Solirubrobacterales bacterium]
NKGFEMIEAHHLFDFPYEAIDVVVHPQSLVHALVELNDGVQLAHLGQPDMRVPISYALSEPDRWDIPVERLDLTRTGSLDFLPVDHETFPCLELAREAGTMGGVAPCALNAADEVAVGAFLAGRIPFDRIPVVVEGVLEEIGDQAAPDFDQLFEADLAARERAEAHLEGVVSS